MKSDLLVLIQEAIAVYFLVLWSHSLRRRFGLAHFYAIIGCLTAITSWVTDAGVRVNLPGVSFMVGSTVFYTALLLSVFVIYVFDGPRATSIAISTIAGVSILVPVIAFVLHLQIKLSESPALSAIPIPSFRQNTASVVATLADLLFLAMAWEFLGKPRLHVPLWLRSFSTLLGVMWLDVVLFSVMAFSGTPLFLSIMKGTFVSRLCICLFAYPFLYAYLLWQNRKYGMSIEHRPVLAIFKEVTEIRHELTIAQVEIERRKKAERENESLIGELQAALAEVKTLRGFLPTCSHCKKIRDEDGSWYEIEQYIQSHSDAKFSHGVCPTCMKRHYPEVHDGVERRMEQKHRD
ncbi:MAG: hypothetical protein QM796_03105 [Chthoniobacteraceae bacterium]